MHSVDVCIPSIPRIVGVGAADVGQAGPESHICADVAVRLKINREKLGVRFRDSRAEMLNR